MFFNSLETPKMLSAAEFYLFPAEMAANIFSLKKVSEMALGDSATRSCLKEAVVLDKQNKVGAHT